MSCLGWRLFFPSRATCFSPSENSLAQVEICDMSLTSITAPSPLLIISSNLCSALTSLALLFSAILQIQAKSPLVLTSFFPRDYHKSFKPDLSTAGWCQSSFLRSILLLLPRFTGSNPSVAPCHLARPPGINGGQNKGRSGIGGASICLWGAEVICSISMQSSGSCSVMLRCVTSFCEASQEMDMMPCMSAGRWRCRSNISKQP